MRSLFKFNQLYNIVLSSVLITFSMAVLNPPPVHAQIDIGFNDINFGVKMQKLLITPLGQLITHQFLIYSEKVKIKEEISRRLLC